ncbi:hypothetical protein P7C70_g6250, partial [Phenoliferia sp. Uapishka_3]
TAAAAAATNRASASPHPIYDHALFSSTIRMSISTVHSRRLEGLDPSSEAETPPGARLTRDGKRIFYCKQGCKDPENQTVRKYSSPYCKCPKPGSRRQGANPAASATSDLPVQAGLSPARGSVVAETPAYFPLPSITANEGALFGASFNFENDPLGFAADGPLDHGYSNFSGILNPLQPCGTDAIQSDPSFLWESFSAGFENLYPSSGVVQNDEFSFLDPTSDAFPSEDNGHAQPGFDSQLRDQDPTAEPEQTFEELMASVVANLPGLDLPSSLANLVTSSSNPSSSLASLPIAPVSISTAPPHDIPTPSLVDSPSSPTPFHQPTLTKLEIFREKQEKSSQAQKNRLSQRKRGNSEVVESDEEEETSATGKRLKLPACYFGMEFTRGEEVTKEKRAEWVRRDRDSKLFKDRNKDGLWTAQALSLRWGYHKDAEKMIKEDPKIKLLKPGDRKTEIPELLWRLQRTLIKLGRKTNLGFFVSAVSLSEDAQFYVEAEEGPQHSWMFTTANMRDGEDGPLMSLARKAADVLEVGAEDYRWALVSDSTKARAESRRVQSEAMKVREQNTALLEVQENHRAKAVEDAATITEKEAYIAELLAKVGSSHA